MNENDKKTDLPEEDQVIGQIEASEEVTKTEEVKETEEFEIIETEADAEEIQESCEGEGTEQNKASEGAAAPKKKMRRWVKITLIVGAVLLGIALIILIIGTILFFHYYGLLNYEDRNDSEVSADERVLILQDIDSGERYDFKVDLRNLSEEQTNMILDWHSKNWPLVLKIDKDPTKMTEKEREELFSRVMAMIQKELEGSSSVKEIEITVHDAKRGADLVIKVKLSLVTSAEDVTAIAEYQGEQTAKALLYFDGDIQSMDDQALSALYAKIANAIRDLEKTVAVLTLKQANGTKTLPFAIYRGEVSDEVLSNLLKWSGAITVSALPEDPSSLEAAAREALVKEIADSVANAQVLRYTLLLRDANSGKQYSFVLTSADLTEGQLKPIASQIQKGELKIELDGDPNELSQSEKKALIAKIVDKIRDNGTVSSRELNLKNIADGKRYTLVVTEDEVTREVWLKLLKPGEDVLFTLAVDKDPKEMSKEERSALILTIVSLVDNMDITLHTVYLRDDKTGVQYAFAISEEEITGDQLLALLRQIQRGELGISVGSDPNALGASARAELVTRIFEAIDRIENGKTTYTVTLVDRATGREYTFEIDEDEITEAQLELLLSLAANSKIKLPLSADPSTLGAEQRKALIEEICLEIAYPTRAILLSDAATGKEYTLYFRDNEVTVDQLSYLLMQIKAGQPLKMTVEKDPVSMTKSEKKALLEKAVEVIKTPKPKEYTLQLRDKETGNSYKLIFTKEEINDATVFGYLLAQSQKGEMLLCTVTADPANMTAAERKTLFAALAELIKNPPKEEDDPDALDKLKEHLENMAQNPVKHIDDIYNVLLVGTDERGEDPTYARNSDTMILATINYKDGTITLTSLLRDTYVEYEYYTSKGELRKNQSKLNSAFAVGGIKTLISAIEKNYGVKIDNYVRVNWTSFVDVFEVLGGVDVSVNAKHLEKLNKTILDTCSFFDVDYESKKLAEGGYQHLDPYQTLAYVRYRVDDADFGRTARQREVLTILFNKFKKSSFSKMNELLNTVLPMLTTDLTQGNCASLMLDFPSIIGYKLQQTRVPEWGEYTNTASGDLSINWKKALKRLFQTAYGSLCPEQYK